MKNKSLCLILSIIMLLSFSAVFTLNVSAENESSAAKKTESSASSGSSTKESSSKKESSKEETSKEESREKLKFTLTVISEETGKSINIKNVVEGTSVKSLLDDHTIDLNQLYEDGYTYKALLKYPLSHYKDGREVSAKKFTDAISGSDNAENMYIYSDTKIYAIYFKHIDSINITLSAPVCGTETTVSTLSSKDNKTYYDYSTQTNAPEFECETEGIKLTAGWTISNGNLQTYFDTGSYISDPFTGTFEGGKSYHVTFCANAATGYYLDEKTSVLVNGERPHDHTFHSDYDEIVYSASIDTNIDAVHDEENGKCKVCGKAVKKTEAESSIVQKSSHPESSVSEKSKASDTPEGSSPTSDAEDFQSYILKIMIPVFIILGVMLVLILIIKIVGAVRNKRER